MLGAFKTIGNKIKKKKTNYDIKIPFSMIDLVLSDLKCYLENIDEKGKSCCNFATTMVQSVDAQTSIPRLAKGWSRSRSNLGNDSPNS